jgi:hypothetical protein
MDPNWPLSSRVLMRGINDERYAKRFLGPKGRRYAGETGEKSQSTSWLQSPLALSSVMIAARNLA